MNHVEKMLANALQSGAKATGYNMDKTREYIKGFARDRRYQLYALSGTCSWAFNEHGVVQYAGRAYRYQQDKNGYKVECDPSYPYLRK